MIVVLISLFHISHHVSVGRCCYAVQYLAHLCSSFQVETFYPPVLTHFSAIVSSLSSSGLWLKSDQMTRVELCDGTFLSSPDSDHIFLCRRCS